MAIRITTWPQLLAEKAAKAAGSGEADEEPKPVKKKPAAKKKPASEA